jgi:hypothetical protein
VVETVSALFERRLRHLWHAAPKIADIETG